MDRSLVAVYAEEMIRLADTATLAEPLTACVAGFGVTDAYAISREVLRRREASGWRRVGRKIGFTNRAIWDQYGVYEPILGYMYDRSVTWIEDRTWTVDGWGDEATLSLDGLAQPLVEPEIVFHFRESPPLTGDPAALLGAIDWLGHGFEIVQCHFPGWKFSIADTVADGGLHGRYVAGGGALVLDSPVNALAHLVKLLDALPDHPPIQPGEIVTTGTLTDAMPAVAGDTWSTRFAGLGVPGLVLRLS